MTLNASSLKMLRFCYSTCKDPLFRRIPADPRQAMAGPQFQDEVLQIELELNDSSSRPGLKPNKSLADLYVVLSHRRGSIISCSEV